MLPRAINPPRFRCERRLSRHNYKDKNGGLFLGASRHACPGLPFLHRDQNPRPPAPSAGEGCKFRPRRKFRPSLPEGTKKSGTGEAGVFCSPVPSSSISGMAAGGKCSRGCRRWAPPAPAPAGLSVTDRRGTALPFAPSVGMGAPSRSHLLHVV